MVRSQSGTTELLGARERDGETVVLVLAKLLLHERAVLLQG